MELNAKYLNKPLSNGHFQSFYVSKRGVWNAVLWSMFYTLWRSRHKIVFSKEIHPCHLDLAFGVYLASYLWIYTRTKFSDFMEWMAKKLGWVIKGSFCLLCSSFCCCLAGCFLVSWHLLMSFLYGLFQIHFLLAAAFFPSCFGGFVVCFFRLILLFFLSLIMVPASCRLSSPCTCFICLI